MQPVSRLLSAVDRFRARPAAWGLLANAIAWAAFMADMGRNPLIFVLAGGMVVLATILMAQWMFGPGMRSVRALGFGSNREALRYAISTRGARPTTWIIAFLSMMSALGLWHSNVAEVPFAALSLAMATFFAVTAAMRLDREWPADKTVQSD
jgi:hypothetical protein